MYEEYSPDTNSNTRMKGNFGLSNLISAAVMIVVVIIVVSIGADIVGEVGDTQTVGTYERNITDAGLDAYSDFSDWFAIIVIVVIAVVIIGMLLGAFGGFGRRTE